MEQAEKENNTTSWLCHMCHLNINKFEKKKKKTSRFSWCFSSFAGGLFGQEQVLGWFNCLFPADQSLWWLQHQTENFKQAQKQN